MTYKSFLTSEQKRLYLSDFEAFLKSKPKLTQSEAFYLYLENQCNYSKKEIAEITGRNYETIKTTINRAKAKI